MSKLMESIPISIFFHWLPQILRHIPHYFALIIGRGPYYILSAFAKTTYDAYGRLSPTSLIMRISSSIGPRRASTRWNTTRTVFRLIKYSKPHMSYRYYQKGT
uniref:Uncharacterized protein n=1 Tax=Ditylum brightwellii TaxID=49249 RepID=A0A7S4RWF2_9STRA